MRRALTIYSIAIAALAALNAWGAGDDGGIYLTQATLLAAGVTTSILAIVIGNSLGRERREMAPGALLRPIARERYAWTIFGVDAIALALAYAIAVFLIVGAYQVAHHFPPIDGRGASVTTCIVLPLGAILAFYALTAVWSVTTRGSRFASILIGPAAVVLWLGATAQVHGVARVFQTLCFINPMMYLMAASQRVEVAAHPDAWSPRDNGVVGSLSVGADAALLYAIGLAALTLASLSWKRAEL